MTAAVTLVTPSTRALAANERVRFGLIGAGDRGQALLKAALQAPNVQAVAVSDVYSRRLEQAKVIAGDVQTFIDFRHLLDDHTIDAVFIATPQHQHALNFVPAIQAGKDVYVEKTMAFNPDHARRMRLTIEGSDRVVQVGIQSVSGAAYERAEEFASAERLGNVTAIHTHHFRNAPYGGWRRPIPPDCDVQNVDWRRFEGEAASHDFDPQRLINWRFFWDYSGGNFFENMVHQVGFWYKLLNLKIPRSVTAVGFNYFSPDMEVPDSMDVSMDQPGDLLFTWNSGFGNNFYGEDGNDLALGDKGTLMRVAEKVAYFRQGADAASVREIIPVAPATAKTDIVGSSRETDAHVRNFFDCVRSRKETNCTFELGYRSAIACQMAIAAVRQGRTVRWDAEREQIL